MKYILAIAIMCCAIASCQKQERENTYISQEESIENYLMSVDVNYRVERLGSSNRVVVREGVGLDSLERGDSLYFYYSGYVFSLGKGALFATNEPSVLEQSGINLESKIMKIKYGSDDLIAGLEKGLAGVKTGEFCYIVFSAKYGFGNSIVFNLPKLTPLFYEITVEKVVKKDENK